jgi:hypothetical protein
MTDIVERLRVWCHRPDHLAIKDLLDEAARSITDWQLEADVHRKRAAAAVAEIARLRLTDAEREAVEFFAAIHNEGYGLFATHTDTLRKLLERTK